jgi:hypothetical protein
MLFHPVREEHALQQLLAMMKVDGRYFRLIGLHLLAAGKKRIKQVSFKGNFHAGGQVRISRIELNDRAATDCGGLVGFEVGDLLHAYLGRAHWSGVEDLSILFP